MNDMSKKFKKGFTLIEIIIVVMFSVVILLAGVNLIRLVIVSRTGSATEYDIQSSLRIASDVISKEIRKSGQLVMLSEDKFLDKTSLESGWDYIGIENSSSASEKDIVHYQYNSLTRNHKKKILAKAVKSTTYDLSFKKFASEGSNKLLEFTLLGYVHNNTSLPKEKLLTEIEARNVAEIKNENTDSSGIISVDTNRNSVSKVIKFMKKQAVAVASGDFDISFNANGGSPTPLPQKKVTGDLLDPVTDPVKPGDTFNAWYKAPTGPGTPTLWNFTTDTVTENMTLIANYNSSKYHEIKFNTNGGLPEPIPQNIQKGELINLVENPSRGSDVFKYWYVKPEPGDAGTPKIWDFSTDRVTKDITLVSFYDIGSLSNEYEITFNADGGTPEPAPKNVKENHFIDKPIDPQKPNYIFTGWAIAPITAGSLSIWNFNSNKVTKAITLIAQYEPSYSVIFNANGGSPTPIEQNIKVGGLVANVTSPAKSGNVFEYWYDSSKGSSYSWDFSNDRILKETELVAKWSGDSDVVTPKPTTLSPTTSPKPTTSPSTTSTSKPTTTSPTTSSPTTTSKPPTSSSPTASTSTPPNISPKPTPKPTPKPRVNVWITLVLDKTGSMNEIMSNSSLTKTKAIRKAVSELLIVCNKNPNIEINIVPFDEFGRGDGTWYNAKDDADLLMQYFDYSPDTLNDESHPLFPLNGTNIGDGLRIGYGNLLTRSAAEKAKDVKRYFILFSDGEPNLYTVKFSTKSYLDTILNRYRLPLSHHWLWKTDEYQLVENDLSVWYDRDVKPDGPASKYANAVAKTIDPNFVKTYLVTSPGIISAANFVELGQSLSALQTVFVDSPAEMDAIFKTIANDAIDPE